MRADERAVGAHPRYIVGIDIGTQSIKAVVTDQNLKVAAIASESYDVSYPKAGWAEQDPLLWESALPRVIASALQKAGITPQSVAAIGVAGQLDGCIAVGRDGLPLEKCIIWMDRRAVKQAESVDAQSIRKKTGIIPDAGHMAAKVAWLKQNGTITPSDVRCFHQPVSYLVSRLTDRHVFDRCLASTTMLYSLETQDYDPELLAGFKIHREEMPEIADADSAAGPLTALGSRLTGLPQGIPVAVGTGDDFSATLGAGVVTPGQLVCVLGTAEVVGAIDRTLKIDEKGLVETHPFFDGSFFIENPGWLSGGTLTWFLDTFRLSRVEELDELASSVPAGSEGLLFLPALSGTMAPEWNASARGCFYGLTPSHGLAHMARAVLEGCAFAMKDVLDRLVTMDVPIQSILLSGGGAKSTLWAQIRSDVSSLPVFIAENKDTSPMGAVILAAVAGGLQPNVEAGARLVNHTSTSVQPNSKHAETYRKSYQRYRLLFESLKPVFNEDARG